MFKHGDKVICVSDRLVKRYGFKYGDVYYVNFCGYKDGRLLLTIKNSEYAFSASDFELFNTENLRRLKILHIKNKIGLK